MKRCGKMNGKRRMEEKKITGKAGKEKRVCRSVKEKAWDGKRRKERKEIREEREEGIIEGHVLDICG